MYSVNSPLNESMANADRWHSGLVFGRVVRVALVTGANIGLAVIVAAIVLLLLLALFLAARRRTVEPPAIRSRGSGPTPRRAAPQAVADTDSSASQAPNEMPSAVEGVPTISDAGAAVGIKTRTGAQSDNGDNRLVAVDSLTLADIPATDGREPLPVSSTAPQETFSWSMPEEWSAGTPSTQGVTEAGNRTDQQAASDQRPDPSPQGATDASQLGRTSSNIVVLQGKAGAGGGGDDTAPTGLAGRGVRSASRAAELTVPGIAVNAVQEVPSRVSNDNDERNHESRRTSDDEPQEAATQLAEQQPIADPPASFSETHARVFDALHMARLLDETLRNLAQAMEAAESQNREMRDRMRSMEKSSEALVAFRDSLRHRVSVADSADDLAVVQELLIAVVENPNNLMVLLRLFEQGQRLSTVVQEYADLRRLIQST